MFTFDHLQARPLCDCYYIAPELLAAGHKCNKCTARGALGQVGVGAVSAGVSASASLLTIAIIGGLIWYFTRY
jgi:hypothetical protein